MIDDDNNREMCESYNEIGIKYNHRRASELYFYVHIPLHEYTRVRGH